MHSNGRPASAVNTSRRFDPRHWSLWSLDRPVLAYLAVVEAAALIVIASTARLIPVTGQTLMTFGLLTAGMLVHEEASRGIERIREIAREGSPHTHPQSIWFFAAVLLLPPPLIAAVIAISYAYLWLRVYHQRPPLHRKIFSASTVVLGCCAARLVLAATTDNRTLPPMAALNGPVGLGVLVGAALMYWLVNYALVVAVIIMTNPDQPARRALGDATEQLIIGASVGLGFAVALIMVTRPWLLPILLLTVLAIHIGLLVPQYRTAARTDAKTGLVESVFWHELAAHQLARAKATSSTVGVLFLDLDHFKQINDRYGHLAGDDVLRAVAHAMKRVTRSEDLVGRWGGEEFAVLIPNTTSETIVDTAERLRIAISQITVTTTAIGGAEVTIDALTASVGAAIYPTTASDLDVLLLSADTALYQAKDQGRNQVQVSPVGSVQLNMSAPDITER